MLLNPVSYLKKHCLNAFFVVFLSSGVLSFYNSKSKQLMHSFKTKFPQPVIPAFMVRAFLQSFFIVQQLFLILMPFFFPLQVWNGSFSVVTGLQVPSIVQSGQRKNSNTSSSNASLTQTPPPSQLDAPQLCPTTVTTAENHPAAVKAIS